MKITYIQVTAFVWFLYILLFGELLRFEETGDNIFHIQVNGREVGVLQDAAQIEDMVVAARKEIAGEYSELLLMDIDVSCTGEELLWGTVDEEETVYKAMKEVLRGSIIETMHRAYTVKVNEFVVSLSSIDEVVSLLQTAVDKYDAEGKFEVHLHQDTDREFSLLVADIAKKEVTESLGETGGRPSAGMQTVLGELYTSGGPEKELDFEDYELGILEMSFPQEVEIVETYLPKSRLMSLDQAVEQVIKEQETVTTYEVVAGDTLTGISLKVNIPMDQIVAMNDTLEDENSILHIGDELIITVPEPELSVVRTEESYIEEIYDAAVIYIENNSWYTNQSVVRQQPSAGFRKIIAVSTYENDKLISREIIKEEVVMEAVAKVVERGTKVPPTYIKPLNGGYASSGFGPRKAPVKGASTYHKAQDWAVPTGTPIFASSGGTVVKAGWGSGYGYVVYINHEDGRQTRYAHLSKVLVSVGQKVKQGDRIALSGNTGITSGPHLHFEMLINGVQVDPMKYINK